MRKVHICKLIKCKCKSIHECRRRGLINSFFNAQFNYSSLMTFIRNVLDYLATAGTLLIRNMDGSFFINCRNIQALVAEILKSKVILQLLLKYFVHEFDLETQSHFKLGRQNNFRILPIYMASNSKTSLNSLKNQLKTTAARFPVQSVQCF